MLAGYKTYIVGVMAVLGFVTAYLVGDISLVAAITGIVPAVQAMTMRHGIGSR